MAEPFFATVPADDPGAIAALDSYYAELNEIFPGGFDPGAWRALTAADTEPPGGRFLVLRLAEAKGIETIGCGAVKRLDAKTAEIKRMWIRPDMRGGGLGPRLLERLEAAALELGLSTVKLDTSSHLPIAIAMYRNHGYTEIAPYNDNPYAGHWFEKRL